MDGDEKGAGEETGARGPSLKVQGAGLRMASLYVPRAGRTQKGKVPGKGGVEDQRGPTTGSQQHGAETWSDSSADAFEEPKDRDQAGVASPGV